MESRTFQLLEFSKVLAHLARFAVSEAGQRAVAEIRPAADSSELTRLGRLLDQAVRFSREGGFSLGEFPDLSGLMLFLENPVSVMDLDGACAVKEVIVLGKSARDAVREFGEEEIPDLASVALDFPWPDRLWAALGRCLDQEGRLRDESSPELAEVRGHIRSINRTCTRKVKDFVEQKGLADFLQEDFITISSDRYVLPLKSNFKGRVDGVIHDYSQTGETCYFEPLFLVELNNRLQELRREEREEERKVLAYLTGLARDEMDGLASVSAFLVELDVLLAKVKLAGAIDGRPIEVGGSGEVRLGNARHPLLALSGGKVQGLDILLSPDEKALIVSGGNAGGKTVCLKTLGLTALMVLSGLPVAVNEGGVIPAWSKLYVFMGDEQSLEASVSTFTAQISSLNRVFPEIDENTLVILDEFGAGTDPTQGAALAQALMDVLIERGARVAAATHFPALKAYGLSREGVRSASVLFDPATRKPLFRLAYDQVGASIALDVAREHGLDHEVIRRAEEYLLLEGSDTSSLMSRLNELAVTKEEEVEALEKERQRLAERRLRLSREFEEEKKKLLEEVRAASRDILKKWQAGRMERKKALRELAKARKSLAPEVAPPAEEKKLTFADLVPGAAVLYRPWGKQGVIVDTDERKPAVKLDFDGISLWAGMDEILAGERPATKPAQGAAIKTTGGEATSMRLDIRGLRADPALNELSKFLDRALLKGFSRVEIIHGKGSGALRREVHQFLKDFSPVKKYALASEDEGGEGKTLVDLD